MQWNKSGEESTRCLEVRIGELITTSHLIRVRCVRPT